jgi:hypothetical protein
LIFFPKINYLHTDEKEENSAMCTISYLPLSAGGFLLTQNRDESPQRPAAIFPVREDRLQKKLLFPKDPQGGGSWIATDEQSRLVCLMNGAIGQHESTPPYRLSRGQVVLDAAASPGFDHFAKNYLLEGIEPFTILFFDYNAGTLIINELKWTGSLRYIRQHNAAIPHIWSAPQLYNIEQQRNREQWFEEWLQTTRAFSPEVALDFHIKAGQEAPSHSLLLNREEKVKTLSITQVTARPEHIQMTYTPSFPEKKAKSRETY